MLNVSKTNSRLIIFIILCGLAFYHFKFFGLATRIFPLLGGGIVLTLLFYYTFNSQHQIFIKRNFSVEISILIISVVLSSFIAELIYGQALWISFFQQRFMYFFFLYFLFHFLSISPNKLENILIWFGIIHCGLYVIQLIFYPTEIFDAWIILDRDTIRIRLIGDQIRPFAYIYTLYKFINTKERKYLIYSLLFLVTLFLSAGRQYIVLCLLISFLMLFFDREIKTKTTSIIILSLVFLASFLIFRDIINNMITASAKDLSLRSAYIRIQAIRYFLTDFHPNILSHFFGNGTPSERSIYGMKLLYLKLNRGFYFSDIGIVGIYVQYGVVFVIITFLIYFRLLFRRMHRDIRYIKYYILLLLGTSLTDVHPFQTNSGVIILVSILYIIDCYDKSSSHNSSSI